MGKLKLKRTPEEQAAHDLRKAQKRARKAAKHRRSYTGSEDDDAYSTASKKRKVGDVNGYNFVFDDLHDGAGPSHRAPKPDLDYADVQAQVEEERFREKLATAFDEDERLDATEARMNSFSHIPRRWRGGGMERMDDELGIDPQMMEEEDYAEWVRAEMWKCV